MFYLTSIYLVVQYCTVSLASPQLYPYGTAQGDSHLPRNDDRSSPKVPITTLFPFFNNQHDSLYVDTNGAISFLGTLSQFTPAPFPLDNDRRIIAPYWTDVDIRYGGEVFYRESTDSKLLTRASNEIRSVFPAQYNFQASWIFIATWDNVPFYGANSAGLSKRNTFQCVLITNGRHSFALFLYKEIVWTTGTASNGSAYTGLGGTPAQVGFNAGNSVNYFAVKGSRTSQIINVARMSNINVPGKFLFRIDTEKIEAGGCNTQGTLTVTPRYGSMLGGQRIHIGGPCVSDDDYFEIKYGETSYRYDCERENDFQVTCVTPVFYRTGDINLELIINHENTNSSSYLGVYSITNIAKTAPLINRHQPRYWLDGQKHTISWKSTDIPFGDQFIRIDVVFLRDVAGNLEWIHGGQCVACNVSIDDQEHRFTLLAESYVAAVRITPIGKGSIWVKEGVWSDVFSIIPKSTKKSTELCYDWYTLDQKLPPVDNDQSCPCTLRQALLDTGRFHRDPACNKFSSESDTNCIYSGKAEHCVRLNTPGVRGSGRLCCYDYSGNLMDANGPGGGGTLHRYHYLGDNGKNIPFLSNFYHDIVPHLQCCMYISNTEPGNNFEETSCKKFLRRRPASDCYSYRPPRPAFANGDPHMKTLDGLSYTFNGLGEFVLINDAKKKFTTQVRLAQVVDGTGNKKKATVFTSLVARTLNVTDTVEVKLNSIRVADVLINGIIADFSDVDWLDFTGLSVLLLENSNISREFLVMIQDPKISFQLTATKHLLNIVTVVADESLKGNLTGLLGNYDGDEDNDLTARNGSSIPSNSTLKHIHENFGETWRIARNESLFSYPIGESYSSYNNKAFTPSFAIPTFVANNTICGSDINCLFDLQTTGITEIAVSTKKAMDVIQEMDESLQPVIACGIPPVVETGHWNYTGLLLEDTAFLSCYNGYHISREEIIECKGNRQWTDIEFTCISDSSSDGGIDKTVVFVIIGCVSVGCVVVLICVTLRCYMKRKNKTKNLN